MSKRPRPDQPSLFDPDPMPDHVPRPARPSGKAPPRREPEVRVQCRANACGVPINPAKLMCREHWARVPYELQRRVYGNFVPGQSFETATVEYLRAAAEAVEAVAALEGRDATNVFRAILRTRKGGEE